MYIKLYNLIVFSGEIVIGIESVTVIAIMKEIEKGIVKGRGAIPEVDPDLPKDPLVMATVVVVATDHAMIVNEIEQMSVILIGGVKKNVEELHPLSRKSRSMTEKKCKI